MLKRVRLNKKLSEEVRMMLTEGKKSSIGEAVDKLIKLDSIGMMIIMSNATVLLARQEMEESRSNQQKEVSQLTLAEYVGEKVM